MTLCSYELQYMAKAMSCCGNLKGWLLAWYMTLHVGYKLQPAALVMMRRLEVSWWFQEEDPWFAVSYCVVADISKLC